MGTVDLPKNPHAVNPKRPGAGGMRNLPSHEDLQQTITLILEEETGNVHQYLVGKLPADVLERLETKGSLKEKLYDFINRHYQELFNRYMQSDNDEEPADIVRHSPDMLAELLRSIGGTGRFNTGEIETSPENTQDAMETHINNMLRQKTGAGLFSAGVFPQGNSPVVKCVFKDNAQKPATVTDVKLVVNIPDAELITPLFRHHAAAQYLIKSLISRHIRERIERELNSADEEIVDRITGLLSGTVSDGLNPTHAHQGIEHVRTRGFGMAANLLVLIFDSLKMDYQYIENAIENRKLVIREYDDEDAAGLPDEHYEIRLRYLGREQLAEDCAAYDKYVQNLENKIQHLWNMIEVIYQDSKSVFKVEDYEDLARKNKNRMNELMKDAGDYEDVSFREASFQAGGEFSVERGSVRTKLVRMHERIRNIYEFLYPVERRVMEEQLALLEKEYSRLDFIVNPHQLQSGLLVDADITSIKRRKATLDSMAIALNQFISNVPECFQIAMSV